MLQTVLDKIYSNDVYLNYLRYNPRWYVTLNENPASINDFEKEVKMVSMTKTLIALPNETFIKFDDEQMKFWGEYYKVENGNIIKIN